MNENSKELIDVLKNIEKKLFDIESSLNDLKREMPKVPYYGDLLQDIAKAIADFKNS
jgi:hypothetical protein